VAEDWRVTFDVADDEGGYVGRALRLLHEHEVERDARAQLGDRVAVSGDSGHVFLYADTEAAAKEAENVVSSLFAAHDLKPEGPAALDRWHPLEERWEDARAPMPTTAAERREEHERLEVEETVESQSSGEAAWEVRIEFASHHDAREFATRLSDEGMSVVRRWNFLLVGTNDEDDARELAQRLATTLPPGAVVQVEPAAGQVWQAMGNSPFAVFGGLGG
jgi:hypothetical protein